MKDVFGCARCQVALHSAADGPDPQDILRCPSCGLAENADIVRRETEAFQADQISRRFEEMMAARRPGSGPDLPRPMRRRRVFRFVLLDTGGAD